MNFAPRAGFSAGIGLLTFTVLTVMADPPYATLVARYGEEIGKHPQDYSQRSERAALMLEHGDDGDTTGADIDSLLSHSEWRDEGNCLKAVRLSLQGRLEDAKVLAQANIRLKAHVQEQSRLLARVELSLRDTAAAIAAYRQAWDQARDENDYVDLLDLERGRGAPPEDLLRQGLNLYPHSPGAVQTIFEVYSVAGDSVSLQNALGISDTAERVLWPQSVDWKLRHAQVLLSLRRPHEAKTVLLEALELVDGNPRLQDDAGQPLRREIFTSLKAAQE